MLHDYYCNHFSACPRCMQYPCDYFCHEHLHLHLQTIKHLDQHYAFRNELLETLYHPDRYERMVATYGEVWADIHLPY